MDNNNTIRCGWVNNEPIYIEYHDNEWGNPQYNDRKLFELLNLEGAQAGLSWITILKKRENYRLAFDNFDPYKIAQYDENKITELLATAGIIRNRLKIQAVVTNAQAYIKICERYNSFSDYMWQFVNNTPIQNQWKTFSEVPTQTEISQIMAKTLKKDGFKFVGNTICYAFMQAVGMVNDHIIDCFCHKLHT